LSFERPLVERIPIQINVEVREIDVELRQIEV